jgi:NADH dehydrogenase FAD-containing subunit
MSENQLQIVVLGAGYAGLLAALRLAGKTRGQGAVITLVNASDKFVERPRLHQFAANRFIAPRPIAEVLKGTQIRFVQGFVTGIDASRREVTILREGRANS